MKRKNLKFVTFTITQEKLDMLNEFCEKNMLVKSKFIETAVVKTILEIERSPYDFINNKPNEKENEND